jgi:hypothetical protein
MQKIAGASGRSPGNGRSAGAPLQTRRAKKEEGAKYREQGAEKKKKQLSFSYPLLPTPTPLQKLQRRRWTF